MNIKFITLIMFSFVSIMITQPYGYARDLYQPEIPNYIASRVDKAKNYRINGQPEKAIIELNDIIAKYPDYYRAYYNQGLALADIKKYQESIEALNKALEIRHNKNINEATIFNSLGATYMDIGNYDSAEKLLKEGEKHKELLKKPSKGKLFNNLGVLYFNKANFIEAERYWQLAVTESNDNLAKNNLKILEKAKRDVKAFQKKANKENVELRNPKTN